MRRKGPILGTRPNGSSGKVFAIVWKKGPAFDKHKK